MRAWVHCLAMLLILLCHLPAVAQRRLVEAEPTSPVAAADRLLRADRDFSIQSGHTQGLGAFHAMFDDDVILIAMPIAELARGRVEAVNLLARSLGGNSGQTEWTPIRVGISADGQHGFTLGYTVTRQVGRPPNYGKYLSYWILRPGGWRVALHKRVPRSAGEVSAALRPPALPSRLVPVVRDPQVIDRTRVALERREREFSQMARQIGLRPAFAYFGSPDAANVGGSAAIVFGNEAISEMQGTGASQFFWVPDETLVASSGDLGISWGLLRPTGSMPAVQTPLIPWLRIWRRSSSGEGWLYVGE